MVVRSEAWVCGLSLAAIVDSNSTGGYGCLFAVSVVCFQVEVSVTSRSLVQRSPTGCGVSECGGMTQYILKTTLIGPDEGDPKSAGER